MHVARSIVLVPAFVLATAVAVSAQQASQSAPTAPRQRGYVAALAGVVSNPPTSAAFAVEYADNINLRTQAYVALSYFENLMEQPLRDDLATLGSNLTSFTGKSWELSGRDRGVALVAGGKYLFGNGNVRPYAGGGAGVMSVRRTVTDARLGDITRAVFNDFTVGSVDLSLAPASLTRPVVEAAFGVGILKGNTYVDVGYRYRKSFRLSSGLDFSQIAIGVGYSF